MQKVIRILSGLGMATFVGAFLFFYLAAPTRTGAMLLNALPFSLGHYLPFLTLLSALGFLICLATGAIERRLRWRGAPRKVETLSPPTRGLLVVCLIFSGVALFIATVNLNAPLDWDEIERVTFLTQGKIGYVLNPLTTLNHPLSTFVTYLSTTVFGFSKAALRIPALLFSAALLVFLSVWVSRRYSPFTAVLVTAHLAVNGLVGWYLHSFRGYVTLMLFSLALYRIADEVTRGRKVDAKTLAVAGGLTVACLFTHGFGGIFALCLFVSLVLWAAWNPVADSQKVIGSSLISLVVLAALLEAGFLFASHVEVLDQAGFLTKSTLDLNYKLTRAALVFGSNQVWFLKIALLIAAACFLARNFLLRMSRWDFLNVFICVSVLFVGGAFLSLRVDLLEGRMLLVFLVPFLLWVGETVANLPLAPAKAPVMMASAALLTLIPLSNRTRLLTGEHAHFKSHEAFAERVAEAVSPSAQACVEYSGEPRAMRYFEHYYLLKLPKNGECRGRFLVHIAQNQFGERFPLSPTIEHELTLLFSDEDGRMLFERLPAHERLAKSPVVPTRRIRSAGWF